MAVDWGAALDAELGSHDGTDWGAELDKDRTSRWGDVPGDVYQAAETLSTLQKLPGPLLKSDDSAIELGAKAGKVILDYTKGDVPRLDLNGVNLSGVNYKHPYPSSMAGYPELPPELANHSKKMEVNQIGKWGDSLSKVTPEEKQRHRDMLRDAKMRLAASKRRFQGGMNPNENEPGPNATPEEKQSYAAWSEAYDRAHEFLQTFGGSEKSPTLPRSIAKNVPPESRDRVLAAIGELSEQAKRDPSYAGRMKTGYIEGAADWIGNIQDLAGAGLDNEQGKFLKGMIASREQSDPNNPYSWYDPRGWPIGAASSAFPMQAAFVSGGAGGIPATAIGFAPGMYQGARHEDYSPSVAATSAIGQTLIFSIGLKAILPKIGGPAALEEKLKLNFRQALAEGGKEHAKHSAKAWSGMAGAEAYNQAVQAVADEYNGKQLSQEEASHLQRTLDAAKHSIGPSLILTVPAFAKTVLARSKFGAVSKKDFPNLNRTEREVIHDELAKGQALIEQIEQQLSQPKEAENAQQEQKAGPDDGSGGAQPEVRQEDGNPPGGGQGVQSGRPSEKEVQQAQVVGGPPDRTAEELNFPAPPEEAQPTPFPTGTEIPPPAFPPARTDKGPSPGFSGEPIPPWPEMEPQPPAQATNQPVGPPKAVAAPPSSEPGKSSPFPVGDAYAVLDAIMARSSGQPHEANLLTEESLAPLRAAKLVTKASKPKLTPSGRSELLKGRKEHPGPRVVREEVPESTSLVSDESGKEIPTVELPLENLTLSEDVPNFKEGANAETGVIEPLSGKYERLGTAPIVVWERNNGKMEVVTGRHRMDLARRSGEKTIPSQVVKESEGWTQEKVSILDAEANIRDGQGKVSDYVNYFRNGPPITDEEASRRGLLSREKGRDGFRIGKYASDDLYAGWKAGKISTEKAAAIADIGRDDAGLQQLGLDKVREGRSADEIRNILKMRKQFGKASKERNLLLFGEVPNDKDQELTALAATEIQDELRSGIAKANKAAKGKLAGGPEAWDAIKAENKQIEQLLYDWDKWETDPKLYREARQRAGLPVDERGDEGQAGQGAVLPPKPPDEGGFGLDRAPSSGPPKPAEFPDHGKGTQRSMISKDGLPGQQDLFNTEGSEPERAPVKSAGGVRALVLGHDEAANLLAKHTNAEKASEAGKAALESLRNIGKPGGGLESSFGLSKNQIEAIKDLVVNSAKWGYYTAADLIEATRKKWGEKWKDAYEPAIRQLWDELHGKENIGQEPPKGPEKSDRPEVYQGPVAARNAITELITGEPRVRGPVRPQEELLDNADPRRVDSIIERFNADPKAPLSDQDTNDLMVRLKLRNDALYNAVERGDPVESARLHDEVRELARVLQLTGTAQGQALASRQSNIEQDWSFGHMLKDAEVASGEPLSEVDMRKIQERASRLKDLDKQIDAVHEKKAKEAADVEVDKVTKEIKEGTAESDVPMKVEARFKKFMEVVDAWWNPKVDAARERMKSYWSGAKQASLPVDVLADMAIIGADYIKKGATTIGTWTAKMVDSYGEGIRPHAKEIWDAIDSELAKQEADLDAHLRPSEKPVSGKKPIKPKSEKPAGSLRDTFEKAGKDAEKEEPSAEEKIGKITDKLQKRSTDKRAIARLAHDLMRVFAEEGIDSREPMYDAVHKILDSAIPDWTLRDTIDACGNYGLMRRPSTDEVSRIVSNIHSQSQKLSALDDLINRKKAPLRSGDQRLPPSDETRELDRELKRVFRESGIQPTDPYTQQRSILLALKTKLEHSITDMEEAIQKDSMIRKTTEPQPTDAEYEKMKERYGMIREQYDVHFAAEREVERLERAINNVTDQVKRANAGEDIWKGQAKTPKAKSDRIDALQANLDALKDEREALKAANAGVIARLLQVRMEAAQSRINELSEQLKAGKFPEKGQPAAKPTKPELESLLAEAKELQAKVVTAKKELSSHTPMNKAQYDIAVKKEKARLSRQIADLQSRRAEEDFAPHAKKPINKPVWPKEILELVEKRDAEREGFERDRRRWERANRTWMQASLDKMVKVGRFGLLTFTSTFAHLTGATFWRLVERPIKETVATGYRKFPPTRKLFEGAPIQGGGDYGSMLHGYAKFWTRGMLDGLDSLIAGHNPLSRYPTNKSLAHFVMEVPQTVRDLINEPGRGKRLLKALDEASDALLDTAGAVHEAIKSPVARLYYEDAMRRSIKWEVEHGGVAEDPMVIERSKARAIEAALRAKLSEDNRWVNWVNQLKRIDPKAAADIQLAQFAATGSMPISRIPVNYLGQIMEHLTGLVTAFTGLGESKDRTGGPGLLKAWKKGLDSLTPDEKDVICRRLVSGTTGAGTIGALMLGGFFASGHLGGLWRAGKKKKEDEPEPGKFFGAGKHISKNSVIGALQAGETFAQVYEEVMKKGGSEFEGISSAAWATILGLVDTLPLVQAAELLTKVSRDPKGKVLKEEIDRRITPGWIQEMIKSDNAAAKAATSK